MGRWGWRLFEGDLDIDIACDLGDSFGISSIDWDYSLSQMIHQTDKLAPIESREIYRTDAYATHLQTVIIPYVRGKLNANNLGDRALASARAKESDEDDGNDYTDGRYKTIILGALIMRAGAQISENNIQHLRDIAPRIHCSTVFELPLFDDGFRSPGRAQFLAALDHYQAGVPRSFQEPSCFHCGKVEIDVGHPMKKCANCQVASYCNRDCQRSNWTTHRPSCLPRAQRRSLNV